MGFSVERGYRNCEFWPGSKNQCANSNCLTEGFTALLQKQAHPAVTSSDTRS
jgi:hypothetical protein